MIYTIKKSVYILAKNSPMPAFLYHINLGIPGAPSEPPITVNGRLNDVLPPGPSGYDPQNPAPEGCVWIHGFRGPRC